MYNFVFSCRSVSLLPGKLSITMAFCMEDNLKIYNLHNILTKDELELLLLIIVLKGKNFAMEEHFGFFSCENMEKNRD